MPARPGPPTAAASASGGIIKLLDRLGFPATFFVNARCTEEYPDAVKQIVKSGHDVGGHAYTQDQLPSYMSLEEQERTIRQSIDILQGCGGKKVTGWAARWWLHAGDRGLARQGRAHLDPDVTYTDLPIKIRTPHGTIAGVPTTDFSDNRVLRANPRDLYDASSGTFDYLAQNEPMGFQRW